MEQLTQDEIEAYKKVNRVRRRKQYRENIEKSKQKSKDYYESHREEYKKRYEENKDKAKEAAKLNYSKKKEKMKEDAKKVVIMEQQLKELEEKLKNFQV